MSVTPLPAALLCRHAYHSYPSPQQFFDSYVAVEACHTRPPDDSPGWGPWIAQHPFSRVFNTGNTDVGLTGHVCLYCRSGTMKSWASSRLDSRKKYAQQYMQRQRERERVHAYTYMLTDISPWHSMAWHRRPQHHITPYYNSLHHVATRCNPSLCAVLHEILFGNVA